MFSMDQMIAEDVRRKKGVTKTSFDIYIVKVLLTNKKRIQSWKCLTRRKEAGRILVILIG